MQTTAAKFAHELRKLISEEEQKVIEYIVMGHLDQDSYQRYVGMVKALRAVVEMMEIAQTNAEKI
jgi:flavorubredoxin